MHLERFEPHRDPDELDTLPMTLPLDIDCIETDAANIGGSHDPGLHAELSDEPGIEHEVPLQNLKLTPPSSQVCPSVARYLMWPQTC